MNQILSGQRGRPAIRVPVGVIRAFYAQGYSFRAIAKKMGIGYGTVRRAFHGQAPRGADSTREEKKRVKKAAG